MYWFLVIICILAIYKILDKIVRIPLMKMKGKRVFITGCDSGFGHALALYLDSKEVEVFAGCLTEKGETELKKKASKLLKTLPLDVTSKHSIEQAYDTVKQLTSDSRGLWGLVNNAGIVGQFNVTEAMDRSVYDSVCGVNLFGLIDVTMAFLPLIKASKGRIVNVSSVLGRTGFPLVTPYCVSKYGVQGFSDSLRLQMKPFGVSVHILQPGVHRTNLVVTMMKKGKDDVAITPECIKEEYGEEYFDALLNDILANFDRNAGNIMDVTKTHEHALFGMYPRARYWVGQDAFYTWRMLANLPEWLADYISTNHLFKMPPPKLIKN